MPHSKPLYMGTREAIPNAGELTYLEYLLPARLSLEHGCDGGLVVSIGGGESVGELHEGHVAALAARRHQHAALVHLQGVQRLVRHLVYVVHVFVASV